MSSVDSQQRVLSGMRPTGKLHLGHYHGVLKNWVKLQHEYECFFFVADWHALTTQYDDPSGIEQSVWDMVIDWLAAGVNPGSSTMFIQSQVPEHAELHLLLSMITPLGWLERIPTYKDQQEKLREKDLATYGFLGYPLLQTADILMYRAGKVPVGADQVSHVEITREIARRFNHIYGREPGFEEQAEAAIVKMGKKNAKLYRNLKKRYQEEGDLEAFERARGLLQIGRAHVRSGGVDQIAGKGLACGERLDARGVHDLRCDQLSGQWGLGGIAVKTIGGQQPAQCLLWGGCGGQAAGDAVTASRKFGRPSRQVEPPPRTGARGAVTDQGGINGAVQARDAECLTNGPGKGLGGDPALGCFRLI